MKRTTTAAASKYCPLKGSHRLAGKRLAVMLSFYHKFGPAVPGPGCFIPAGSDGLGFAEADGIHTSPEPEPTYVSFPYFLLLDRVKPIVSLLRETPISLPGASAQSWKCCSVP